jgi:thioredoxin reductase
VRRLRVCILIQGLLGGVKVKNLKSGEITDLPLSGLFFAIGECTAADLLVDRMRQRVSFCTACTIQTCQPAHTPE